MTVLGSLPCNDMLRDFSICKFAKGKRIVLTGGCDDDYGKLSGKVFALETHTGKWQMQPLPDLNVARSNHASLSIEHHVYVACGTGDYGEALSSVEMLLMPVDGAATSWDLIELEELKPRRNPVFSQVAHNQLCILGGGQYGNQKFSDGVVVDLETRTVSRVIPSNAEITFACDSPSFVERCGSILSLVRDGALNRKLIRYNQTDDTITVVRNFGY